MKRFLYWGGGYAHQYAYTSTTGYTDVGTFNANGGHTHINIEFVTSTSINVDWNYVGDPIPMII